MLHALFLPSDFGLGITAVVAFIVCAQLVALVLDWLLGEPKHLHPLVGFGRLSHWVEQKLNASEAGNGPIRGALAWLICVMPLVLISVFFLAWLSQINTLLFWLASVFILYFTLGLKSLGEHASWVAEPLSKNNIDLAREKVSWLVSRETQHMDETQVSKACIESVLENGNDAVYGALFWFLIAGAPGALCYRLANTLDASWGYRNPRFLSFGWWAARTDDWLNYVPARICALSYSLSGDTNQSFQDWNTADCWRRNEGQGFASPNAGIVMASGAGSLQIGLGGVAVYEGVKQYKPPLGSGPEPGVSDISRAVELLSRSVMVFMALQLLLMPVVWMLLEIAKGV